MPDGQEALHAYRDFTEVLREDVAAMLQDSSCLLLLAERDDEPLGYITGRVEDTPRRVLERKGVLQDWYVLEGARRHGVGRALFDELVAHFEREGCELIESATWPFNPVARAAHEGLGFDEVEIRYRKRLEPRRTTR